MTKIIQLSENLSNKIAAGEVVERPASVVKELVENAIDAKSTVIEVHVEEAGLQKIRVIDNGSGIDREDVPLAFERHATSKIKNEQDLFRIRTLGFRGEALPSIASVSKVEVITSTGVGEGTRIVIEGGVRKVLEPASSRKGTDFTVSELFYNTPARLKYMKSLHTELGNITDCLNRIALAHPEVAIKLVHNGRTLLQTNGNGDPRQVLASIYGFKIVKKMIPIKAENLDFKVEGFIALPEITRASRNYISTMINGRFIKNYALTNAVIAGYHTLLPIGRYPIAFLNVIMDPILVDVNVHPAKLEVRLSKEKELSELITNTIKQAFKKETLIPDGAVPKTVKPKSEQISLTLDHLPEDKREQLPITNNNNVKPREIQTLNLNRGYESSVLSKEEREVANKFVQSLMIDRKEREEPTIIHESTSLETDVDESTPLFTNDNSIHTNSTENESIVDEIIENDTEQFEDISEVKSVSSNRVPPLYPIGQMHGTYIFAENENGLYIIDQHAAQERIKYEFYKEKIGDVPKDLQELLIPITLEFSNDEYIKLEENLDELKKVGLFLDPFGINTFIVRSHPIWFPKGEEKETILEIIEQVLAMKKVDLKKLREETAIMMSCKGSIKANHRLRNDEIQALLDTLRKTSDPFTCPHGRPIIIHFSTYEMEKMFKRIM
ncbi:DNA mismatch repair endonuclease MutL [Pallidibacillus pasinlerensis]|uniref:DNA mismatch repair protein MutL n=1 Tax=Pallidibacillus pasinlerensis TaxID=2703818 RepID=A0ABX0A133_9BACI|nr:DNA mismatch repair endonuclease MutL [Pallidibacillus pasinlerensis]NCU17134.1 DNA mismatch repair endonuclease MutL [Pallidibacillus pasinlerensis]